MAFLEPGDILSHLYEGVIDEINRGDDSKLLEAIKAAIAEARGYLTAYDLAAIFSTAGDDRNPILLLYIKDIAVWHYIQLTNPGVEMQLRLDRYEKAIKWFEKVQSGKTNPDLPYPTEPVDPQSGSVENHIKWGGNKKRGNYFN